MPHSSTGVYAAKTEALSTWDMHIAPSNGVQRGAQALGARLQGVGGNPRCLNFFLKKKTYFFKRYFSVVYWCDYIVTNIEKCANINARAHTKAQS